MISIIVSSIGACLAIAAWLLPSLNTEQKLMITSVVLAGGFLAILIDVLVRFRRSKAALANLHHQLEEARTAKVSESPDLIHVRHMKDLSEAFHELRGLQVHSLRMLAYAGNYVKRQLLEWPEEMLQGLQVQLLVRNPETPWKHPPDGAHQQVFRKTEIRNSVLLGNHHRLKGVISEVRFFLEEPTARVLVAEFEDGHRRLYMGFYPLRPRADGCEDFTGTGSGVLAVDDSTPLGWDFIEGFDCWFKFVWQLRLVGDGHVRPLIVVDYDGVLADTNSVKANWIQENLGQSIPRQKCNHTMCAPLIGEAAYAQMATYAYDREASLMASPMPGVEDALRVLSVRWRFVVLTARPDNRRQWAEQWLRAQGLRQYFDDVISSDSRSKIDIATRLGAVALIDDDPRHLLADMDNGILTIQFDSSSEENVPLQAGSWEAIVGLLQWGGQMQHQLLTIRSS